MAAGYPANQNALDQRFGRAVVGLRDALAEVVSINATLSDTDLITDQVLTAVGYSSADVTRIRASFAALASLSAIAHSQAAQPAPNDFFFDAKHLAGAQW
jgi:hypothetical protein